MAGCMEQLERNHFKRVSRHNNVVGENRLHEVIDEHNVVRVIAVPKLVVPLERLRRMRRVVTILDLEFAIRVTGQVTGVTEIRTKNRAVDRLFLAGVGNEVVSVRESNRVGADGRRRKVFDFLLWSRGRVV